MHELSTLNRYFLRYKNKLALGFLFIVISNTAQVFIPLFIRDSINLMKDGITSDLLLSNAGLIVLAALISGVFRFLIRETIIVVSREIEYDLRQDFWGHIQNLSLRFFQNNSTGNIMSHATNDISAVRSYVGPAIMYSMDTITRFVIIIYIIISISPLLTLYTLLPLPFLSMTVYLVSKKIHKKFSRIQAKFSELTSKAQENFSGIRVIKSYVREANEIKSFNRLSKQYLDYNMDKVKVQAFFMPMLFIITGVSIIIVILAGGNMVIDGSLNLGDISAFLIYLGLLIWPMIAFGWVLNLIQQASASMKRLNNFWNEKIEIQDNADTDNTIFDLKGEIEFRDVSFRYNKNTGEVLNKISFKIQPGETLAIVGPTGVGKTSLINLIPRLYDVSDGMVLIDGIDVKKIPLTVLRQAIGLVPQETFLFSDTLKNNILYGSEDKSDEILNKAADISQLTKDVNEFPEKFETILGERGITLSGGQKQRTCLARALSIDPKILILDDSFSAVDTNTEDEILIKLKEYLLGRTSIIISHRISTVKESTRIIFLSDGKILEQGTHDELVALNGSYADLHYKQLLEDELKEIK